MGTAMAFGDGTDDRGDATDDDLEGINDEDGVTTFPSTGRDHGESATHWMSP